MNISLKENNYIYIPNFISESQAKLISKNFKHFCETNNIEGDSQVEGAPSQYNYIDFLELLCEKTPVVSEIVGEMVLPTYSYGRVYKNNNVLEKHKDRHACEISLTIHLSGDKEWPIYIEKPNNEIVELNLNVGDAMLYLGCDAAHWRDNFKGTEYIQTFLHYVLSRGENSFAYFDKFKKVDNKIVATINSNLNVDVKDIPYLNGLPKKENKDLKINESNNKKNISDYIVVVDNILSEELCNSILKEYNNDKNWNLASVGYETMDLNVRNVKTIGISQENIINENFEIRKKLDEEIFKSVNVAINKYNNCFPHCNIEIDTGYDLLSYEVGQFYKEHTDSYKKHPRSVSCSIALNEDYEGGEFAFFNRELKYKLKKGSVILFPSNFMYPHEILPVTKGTRYSIITWFI
jgi:predicted 2-oxoglutarate/Fe(II)-dependent dioxygenase YbiX